MTDVINKHLLPVYDWPMIFYPINTLKGMGITDICVILGGNSVGDIVKLCGDGGRFGVKLTYKHQKDAGGIAQALGLARDFSHGEDVAVILGDNVILEKIDCPPHSPHLWLYESEHPWDFGCADVSDEGTVTRVVEKPSKGELSSNLIATGLYVYPNDVFAKIDELSPSSRGELEITDITNMYIDECPVHYSLLKTGYWYDAGSILDISVSSQNVRAAKSWGKFCDFIGE